MSKAQDIRDMLVEGVKGETIAKELHTTPQYVSKINTTMKRKTYKEDQKDRHTYERILTQDRRDQTFENKGVKSTIPSNKVTPGKATIEQRLQVLEDRVAGKRFEGKGGARELIGDATLFRPQESEATDQITRTRIRHLDELGVSVNHLADVFDTTTEEINRICNE